MALLRRYVLYVRRGGQSLPEWRPGGRRRAVRSLVVDAGPGTQGQYWGAVRPASAAAPGDLPPEPVS